MRVTILLGTLLVCLQQAKQDDLTELSIEELMDVPITSVSKKEQPLSRTAAAVFVIRGEDIRRSGATTIPEALRLAPGVQVGRIDGNKWGVSVRGFNDRFSNKLLVMIDGRTVYTPLFAGVFWDQYDLSIENIDRIEVIRGPGAATWGANAVNGVINIIMKPAQDTPGLSLTAGGGTEERLFAGARGGGSSGDSLHYRAYLKVFDRQSDAGFDDWSSVRAGFRSEWKLGESDELSVIGNYYSGRAGSRESEPLLVAPYSRTFDTTTRYSGGDLVARWEHDFTPASRLTATIAFDRSVREGELLSERRDTLEVEARHHVTLFDAHDVVWGVNYRITDDVIDGSFTVRLTPDNRTLDVVSLFVQDEWTVIPDRLRVTAGSRFEYNDFTGFEVLPSLRAAWTPSDRAAVWIAASRAVRSPTRAEEDVRINQRVVPGPVPTVVAFVGDDDFRSEVALSLDAGFRLRPIDSLSLDVAAFYTDYDRLRTLEPGTVFLESSPAPLHAVMPFVTANEMEGRTWGAELAVLWRPVDWLLVHGAYSLLFMDLDLKSGSADTVSEAAERAVPNQQAYLRASFDLPHNLQLDVTGRYVDSLPGPDIPSYVEADVRLSWRPLKNLEIFVVGQNLLHDEHAEFTSSYFGTESVDVARGGYIGLNWRF